MPRGGGVPGGEVGEYLGEAGRVGGELIVDTDSKGLNGGDILTGEGTTGGGPAGLSSDEVGVG